MKEDQIAPATLWIAAPRAGSSATRTRLLGLPLVRRAVLAGERAGFGEILVEEGDARDLPELVAETRARVVVNEQVLPRIPAGRLVVLSGETVAQAGWLRSLAAAPVPSGAALLDRSAAAALDVEPQESETLPRALLAASASRGAVRAAAALRNSEAPSARAGAGRFELGPDGDLRAAERWLLAGLLKENEGFMSRHVERRISLALSRRLARTSVSPNTMTLVSVAVGLAGAAFFLSTRPAMEFAGALLFLLHSILDGCDGELARLKFAESRLGGVLDFWGDNVVHSAVFAAIALAWHRATGQSWALAAGFAAVAGTLASAGFVYRSTMMNVREGPLFTHAAAGPPSALSRAADALARRDFIYLVVLLSAFGKAHWFLAAAAVGAPLYFAVLVGLASRRLGRSFS